MRLDLTRTPYTEAERDAALDRILHILVTDKLHYYQGFHEVALAVPSIERLERLALLELRDFMMPTLDPTLRVLALIPQLIVAADPSLESLIKHVPGHASIEPIITLWTRGSAPEQTERILAAIEEHGLPLAMYLLAAIVLQRKKVLVERVGPTVEHDMASAAFIKTTNDITDLDVGALLRHALELQRDIPLRRLPGYRLLSRHSAVRARLTTVEQGRKAAARLSRRYRASQKISLAVALMVLVAGLAWHKR